jgi:NitT/TauT family transport system permease protein
MTNSSTAAQTSSADRQVTTVTPQSIEFSPSRNRSAQQRFTKRVRAVAWAALPALTFVLILCAWALATALLEIPSYLLPGPFEVFDRLFADSDLLWRNGLQTMTVIAIGFCLTVLIAIPLGLLIALSPLAKRTVYPPVMLLQLVPKIAIAPLLLVWLGFGMENKVLLVILISFFPLVLASVSGFSILDDRLLYLTSSMGASGWQTFWYLRFPAALPIIFAGIKTSATIAITAALVAEFIGSNSGLGFVLLRASGTLDTQMIFAVLVVLTGIGIGVNYLVEFIEWLLTPWQRAKTT